MSGRPPIPIDLAEVERLAGLGLTQAEIGAALGVSVKTLQRRKADSDAFDAAIKAGQARAAREVANALYAKATGGDVTAMIWYEKTRRGLSDRLNVNLDVSKLSDDELQRIVEG